MKYLSNGIRITLAIVLLSVSFICPSYRVKAQSIGDLKKELDAKQKQYNQTEADKNLTEQEREQIKNKIKNNEDRIVELYQESQQLEEEIADLNDKIAAKYQEIKNIINTNQIMNGENSYLEYIFGASNFADFIYRASVAEQLSKYNKELTDQMSKEIALREAKQAEITAKQEEIAELQKELEAQYAKLGEKISSLMEEMSTELDNIKLLKDNIASLQNTYNCSDDEDIDECKERARRATYIPASTGSFKRPINNAIVTANYGYYIVPAVWGYNPVWHAAMDLAAPNGSSVYAAAPGRVVSVTHQSCGNWVVYIVHNINGTRFTTGYWHMRASHVSVGDLVDYNTVIGIQGGGGWEDSCSTGYHLDFVVTLGAYKTDYFVNPRTVSVNPRNYVSFPPLIEYTPGWGTGYSTRWYER
mgnify:CR=1 FL=1